MLAVFDDLRIVEIEGTRYILSLFVYSDGHKYFVDPRSKRIQEDNNTIYDDYENSEAYAYAQTHPTPEPTITPEPTPEATPKPTPTPEPSPAAEIISEKTAIKNAIADMKLVAEYNLAKEANCSRITMLTLGDTTAKYDEKKECYIVTVKGHFFAVDSYGNTGSKYNFTWDIRVDGSDGDSMASLCAAAGWLTVSY